MSWCRLAWPGLERGAPAGALCNSDCACACRAAGSAGNATLTPHLLQLSGGAQARRQALCAQEHPHDQAVCRAAVWRGSNRTCSPLQLPPPPPPYMRSPVLAGTLLHSTTHATASHPCPLMAYANAQLGLRERGPAHGLAAPPQHRGLARRALTAPGSALWPSLWQAGTLRVYSGGPQA